VYENPSEQLAAMGNYEGDVTAGMGNLMFDENSQYFPEQTGNEHVFHTAVLYTGGDEVESKRLQNEADQSCVLDSACTSTVCGYKWFQSYVDNLSMSDVKLVKSRKGEKTFKFGIGLAGSILECEIPAYIAGRRVMIRTDVVEADVPLLLSLGTMASLGMIIDLGNAIVTVFGQSTQLTRTSSGHLSLSLTNPSDVIERAYVVSLESAEPDVLKKQLSHLHKQFGHPSQDKLTSLIKDCVKWKSEYGLALDDIYENCDRCKEFARTPSRPVVAMPMARTFNEKVCMDLKSWNGRWILHLVDMFSRYTISVFVPRKDSTAILCAIIDNWISYFGIMQGIFSDNGGEFRNDELRELSSVLNFSIQTTAADSPFQNGLCEKNHAIVDLILSKLKADYPHIKVEILLRWANMAKNSLQMWCGFSSNQLVFGFNPRLPSIMCDPLPSMNETTLSETLCNTLNIIHDARKAFIQSEAENKIKIALRNRIRSSEAVYVKDDWVYYKRDGRQQWLGPARVIFQDRKVVLIDHGGLYIKVSPNRLTKVSSQFASNGESKDDEGKGMFRMEVEDQPIQDRLPENGEAATQGATPVNEQNKEVVNVETAHKDGMQSDDDGQDEEFLGFSHEEGKKATKEFKAKYREAMNSKLPVDQTETVRRSERNVDKSANQVYMVTIPKSRHEDDDCVVAKEAELDKLRSFEVFEEVPYVGQQCISTRWVLWWKGEQVRARLVARGFEEDRGEDVDSPTVGKSTVRLVLTIAVAKNWVIKSMDIKSAFLQGMSLNRNVYLVPPKEANAGEKVWKLRRCLYGLNDAARQFYESVVEELSRLGCVKSNLDPSLFYRTDVNGLSGVLVSHIDDFLHAGDRDFDCNTTDQLCKRFLAGSNQEKKFSYVGYQISQYASCIVLDQNSYVEGIDVPNMSAERELQKDEPLTKAEMTTFRSLVGSLNWVVHGSRPDLAFSLIELSTKFKNGTVKDLVALKKIVVKAKNSKADIMFPDLGDSSMWKIVVYSDASFANLCEGTGSCIGYIVFLAGQHNRACPIAWKSGKAVRVVGSTEAAETMALKEGMAESLLLKKILSSVLGASGENMPVIAYTDHKGLFEAVCSTKSVKDRRLHIDIAEIKECLSTELLEIKRCSSSEQLADCLTKKGADGKKLLSVLQTGVLPM
jgi:hypothetical protein